MLSFCEGCVARSLVAQGNGHGHIAVRALLPNRRRTRFGRLFYVDKCRQGLVLDFNELGSITSLKFGLGNDEGDAVADTTNVIG